MPNHWTEDNTALIYQHEDELREFYRRGYTDYTKLFTKNIRRKFKARGVVERKNINNTYRMVFTWETKRYLKLTKYPCWLELPLEYQDDFDLLNLVRLHRGEPPYEQYETIMIDLSWDDIIEGYEEES